MTPKFFQTLDCNRTDNNPGSKPSLCLITQRKHQPADHLVFALSTNTMQKETIGLPEQLFSCCLFFFFFFDCIGVFCHMQKEIGRGCLGCWWEKGSQTKLKTEKKSESYWNDFNSMSLAYRMPWNNSISLTWQMFGYIWREEGIWQQLLSSET